MAGQLARTIGQGSNKQNLAYRYDGAGQLIGIEDAAIGQVSTFSYDLAGNRVREKITQKTMQENGLLADVVYQDVRMVYDAQNQLRAVVNGHTDVRIDYDKAGNRRIVQTRVRNTVGGQEFANDTTTVYGYDSMNRQASAQDIINTTKRAILLPSGEVVSEASNTTRTFTYDLAGNRTSERTTGSAEIIYTYDDVKRVVRSVQSEALTQNFYYDGAGRIAASESQITGQGGTTREWRYNRYDVLGQTQDSLIVTRDASSGSRKSTASVAYHDANGEINLGYDAAGNLLGYTQNSNGTVQTTSYDNKHVMGNYVQASATTKQGGASVKLTTNRDANGFVSEISQTTTGGSTKQDSAYYRAFVNDSAGNAVYINQGGGQQQIVQTQSGPAQGTVAVSRLVNPNSGWEGGWVGGPLGAGHIQRQIVVQGQVIARYGDAPKLDVSMEGLNATGGTGTQPGTNSTPVTYANTVEVNLTAPGVNRGVGQQGVSLHTAQEGDTLQSIAQTRLGDSRLWYLIADANSLTVTGDAKLQAGQTLRIPSTTLNANRADTFEPWDPAKAIGSQQPNMPIPAAADGGCGGIGKIIMVVVAVVVSIYTAGAASALLSGTASSLSGAMAAGSAAFSAGGLAGAGAGAFAIGGAAGSIASQLVGNAIGAQEGFSWKGVALSALGGAATAGMEQIGLGKLVAGNNATMGAAVQAAAANALTQGAGVVLGLQNSFDWKGVAASAVGAGVGEAVGDALKNAKAFDSLGSAGAKFAQASVSGLAAGTAAALARGGKIAVQQVAADAFGNALGQSLLDQATSSSPYSVAGGQTPSMGLSLGGLRASNSLLTDDTLSGNGVGSQGSSGYFDGSVDPISQAYDYMQAHQQSGMPFSEVMDYYGSKAANANLPSLIPDATRVGFNSRGGEIWSTDANTYPVSRPRIEAQSLTSLKLPSAQGVDLGPGMYVLNDVIQTFDSMYSRLDAVGEDPNMQSGVRFAAAMARNPAKWFGDTVVATGTMAAYGLDSQFRTQVNENVLRSLSDDAFDAMSSAAKRYWGESSGLEIGRDAINLFAAGAVGAPLAKLPGMAIGEAASTSRALNSRTGMLTGIAEFDQPFSQSPQAAKILSALDRRGVIVIDDASRLPEKTAAQVFRENGNLTLVYDSASTSFVDMLHESRHVAQVQRVEAAGVLGELNFFGNSRILGAAERGAYEYEMRLGQSRGFSQDYMNYLSKARDVYYPNSFAKKFQRSTTMGPIFNVLEPGLKP